MAGFDIFMVFEADGTNPAVKGDADDPVYSKLNAIAVKDFKHGIENKITIGSASGGAGAGKAIFNELVIRKSVDVTSDDLYRYCGNGSHFKSVTIYLRKAATRPTPSGVAPDKLMQDAYLAFVFRVVSVSKIEWSGGGEDEEPTEIVTFVYGAERFLFRNQDANGKFVDTPHSQWWNQINNNDKEPTN